jgi:rubrerythrin
MKKCPYCGRKAKDALSSNWFPVYKCNHCGTKFCQQDGPPCPKCGKSDYFQSDKVYA